MSASHTSYAAPPSPTERRDSRGRLVGVDSIRAVSALIVAIGHLGLMPAAFIDSPNRLLSLAARTSVGSWNAPAAVIVFFVISGFCIHLPYRGDRPLETKSFLVRRLLRVGIPAIAAYCFARYFIRDLAHLYSVIWSVIYEAIYYVIYPIMLPISRRIGWRNLFIISSVFSFGLSLTHLHALQVDKNGYLALGYYVSWFIGLPCWLLGCLLAEREKHFSLLSAVQMWGLRAGVFLVSVLLRIAKFHVQSPLASNCITLNLFALLAFFWIGSEVAYYKANKAPHALEWMGGWSYSLYLMHPLTITTLAVLNLQWFARNSEIAQVCVIAAALCLSYAFHLLVEKPSHKLAVTLSRRVAGR